MKKCKSCGSEKHLNKTPIGFIKCKKCWDIEKKEYIIETSHE